MVDFWVYDVAFLVIFTIWVAWFLYTRKHNLGKEGIIFMYRTQVGVRAINWFSDKFSRFLHSIKYLVIGVGVVIMGIIMWMVGQTLLIYVTRPEVTEVIKAPPIAPLIPYFPKLFGLESFFPPFYFTYFIIALAIVAFVHEFSHGIYMRLFKVKIKSTGIVFLGPILGAFVEEERKGFEKKKNLEQMTILAAGVFANVVFALLFYLIYVSFFFSVFAPAGYQFNSYATGVFPLDQINNIGQDIGERTVYFGGGVSTVNLTEVEVNNRSFLMDSRRKEFLLEEVNLSEYSIVLFDNAPAIQNKLKGAIIMANDVEIKHHGDLQRFMQDTNPGEVVKFTTIYEEELIEYNIELDNHPSGELNIGYLGVGHSEPRRNGVVGGLYNAVMFFKDSSTYYEPTFDGNFAYFILHLLWWIMVINFLVALFNMLPLGILDGGRFFYLLLLSITGSESFAKNAFKFITYFILFMFLLLMLVWAFRVF